MSAAAAPPPPAFLLRPIGPDDLPSLAAMHLRAMRQSLERLGRYDEDRLRQRFASNHDAAATRHITVDGRKVGFLVLRKLSHVMRLDHLVVDPPAQRRGIGSAVLRTVCEEADARQMPVELRVPRGSDAARVYLRQGFTMTGEGAWDLDYRRAPQTREMAAVRALWAAVQRRDWDAVRPLLAPALTMRWWTSGERFDGVEAFVAVQSRQPEGWTLHLLELSLLQDGRVWALMRVDHGPARFFATSVARVEDGAVTALDEYWASAEAPPAWREDGGLPGRQRFDAGDDPRAVPA